MTQNSDFIPEEIQEIMDILDCSEYQAIQTIFWGPEAAYADYGYFEIPTEMPQKEGWIEPSGEPFSGSRNEDNDACFYTKNKFCIIGPSYDQDRDRSLIRIDDIKTDFIKPAELKKVFENLKKYYNKGEQNGG